MLEHEFYMRRAFFLAKKGLGLASPNPLVGCVVVKNGQILSEGYHAVFGADHAERDALKKIENSLSLEGATLYCNLEPCCHRNKKTPPCLDLLLERKVSKVVISNLDPNPYVSGKSVDILKSKGVKVLTGVLENEGKALNEIFFHYIINKKPYIHLKMAQTLDGKIADSFYNSKWISSEAARKEVHELRFKYDAVMIGSKTLRTDDPSLTIRMGVDSKGKSPFRIIVGSFLEEDLLLKVFNDEFKNRTILAIPKEKFLKGHERILSEREVRFLVFDSLEHLLVQLGQMEISSILLEGGACLLSSFLDQKLVNRFTSYITPSLLGSGVSLYSSEKKRSMNYKLIFKESSFRPLENQIVLEGVF